MNPDANLIDYYAKRAAEYERIYQKPERQKDLSTLRSLLQKTVKERDVLEVACGAGYWTQVAAQTARSKHYGPAKVSFEKRDAFDLSPVVGRFNAGLATFWFSHLKKSQIREFLVKFHQILSPNALVILIDNNYVPGSSTPISRMDEEGNTYQLRTLDNGSQYEVLKNFPNETELRAAVGKLADRIKFIKLTYYWFLSYYVMKDKLQ